MKNIRATAIKLAFSESGQNLPEYVVKFVELYLGDGLKIVCHLAMTLVEETA